MSSQNPHVLIIGAGVIGLQTAILLLEVGYKVTIVAAHFPGDRSIEYTSPWAGAQWHSFATANDIEACDWDMQSYQHWTQLVKQNARAAEKIGIGLYPHDFYLADTNPESTSTPWYASHVESFSAIPTTALPPNTQAGFTYTAPAMNVPVYLQHLFQTATASGADILRTTLPTKHGLQAALRTAEELLNSYPNATSNGPADFFVNASGIGAKLLVPDLDVYPIRGQTLLINRSAPRLVAHEEKGPDGEPVVTYIIPRPGSQTTILGGTMDAGNWAKEPDQEISAAILERCRKLWPGEWAHGNVKVLSESVGLRPARKGGARVEVETLKGQTSSEKKRVVIHAYGHGGAGFQQALGSARKVVQLLRGEQTASAKL